MKSGQTFVLIAGEMPAVAPDADRWACGTDMAYLQELCDYWVDEFDWRSAERRLNRFPQYIPEVEGQTIHLLHVPGSGEGPRMIVLTHGRPGSVFEFHNVIDRLAHPRIMAGMPGTA